MYDDFYSALEKGRIEPITFWEGTVSKWDYIKQTRLMIELLGKVAKEEREGRYGSDLHRYAMDLAYYIGRESNIQETMRKERESTTNPNSIMMLPDELSTPNAMKIWDKAKKASWIKDDYSFNGTKYQMAYAAEIMGTALNLKYKWKPFQNLWKCKNLAQTRYESKERIGKVERDKEIEEAFSL